MIIHYVKANPSGNITFFILDSIAPEDRKRVNELLLKKEPMAEQCACLTIESDKPSVEMLGGEFCGNASRSSAAYALYLRGGESGDFQVRCSGFEGLLPAHVEKKGDNQFEASIQLPLPLVMKTIPISYNVRNQYGHVLLGKQLWQRFGSRSGSYGTASGSFY